MQGGRSATYTGDGEWPAQFLHATAQTQQLSAFAHVTSRVPLVGTANGRSERDRAYRAAAHSFSCERREKDMGSYREGRPSSR